MDYYSHIIIDSRMLIEVNILYITMRSNVVNSCVHDATLEMLLNSRIHPFVQKLSRLEVSKVKNVTRRLWKPSEVSTHRGDSEGPGSRAAQREPAERPGDEHDETLTWTEELGRLLGVVKSVDRKECEGGEWKQVPDVRTKSGGVNSYLTGRVGLVSGSNHNS